MKHAGIYCLTSPSGKVYVGQSVNIQRRLSVYRSGHCRRQTKIHCALMKYGFENFKVTVLEKCDKEHLDNREKFWIEKLDAVEQGYNLKTGGSSGYIYSAEAKERMSSAQIGRKPSAETRAKLSRAKQGSKLPAHTRDKMRDSYRNLSEEKVSSMKALRRERNPKWGIQPSTPGKFKVMFNVNHVTYYHGKFCSYEDAQEWRDSKLKTLII